MTTPYTHDAIVQLLDDAILKSNSKDIKALSPYLRTSSDAAPMDIGIVLYTDGGFKAHLNKTSGFGVHGFLYSNVVPKVGYGVKGSVPSDYGYMLNTNIYGDKITTTPYAIKRNSNHNEFTDEVKKVGLLGYVDIMGSSSKSATNNTAELNALLLALQTINSLKVKRAHLRLDAEYVLHFISGRLDEYANNNWRKPDGTSVANIELLKEIQRELDLIDLRGETFVTYEWVKGHSDFVGNIAADALASKALIGGYNGFNEPSIAITDVKGYWSSKSEYNRLITEPRFYFTTQPNAGKSDLGHFYHIGSHGKNDDMLGKKMSDISHAVIMLTEPDHVLETVREAVKGYFPRDMGDMYIARLDVITKPAVYCELVEHGFKFMVFNPRKRLISTSEDLPVVKIPDAPRLSFKAQGYFINLETILCDYVLNKLSDTYRVTDITNNIYESIANAKGVEKRKVIEVAESAYKVMVDYPNAKDGNMVPITLTYSIDIPRKVNLQRLAEVIDKVEVITWAESGSNVAFRYVTIFKTTNGEYGVWAGAYSNLRLTT